MANKHACHLYADCYLGGTEEVTTLDPVEVLTTLQKRVQSKAMICNREPCCMCSSELECTCDDDNFGEVTVELTLASNCMCNLEVSVIGRYKLYKNWIWRVFRLQEHATEDDVLFDIDTFNNKVKLSKLVFTPEDKISISGRRVTTRFNYMQFEE